MGSLSNYKYVNIDSLSNNRNYKVESHNNNMVVIYIFFLKYGPVQK